MSSVVRCGILVAALLTATPFALPSSIGPVVAFADELSDAELVERLGSDNSSDRIAAYNALRTRKSKKALPLLATHLPTLQLSHQYYGVLILNAYEPKEVRSTLKRLLKSDSAYLRVCAAAVLASHGERGASSVIQTELFREGLDRAEWRQMMIWLRYGRLPSDEKLQRALADTLVVGAPTDTIIETAQVLRPVDTAVADEAFAALSADPRVGVQVVAAAYLCGRGQDHQRVLAAALGKGAATSSELYFVRDVVTGIDAPPTGPELIDGLIAATRTTTRPLDLRVLVQILGKLKNARALPRLKELAKHESSLVAKAAAQEVGRLTGVRADTAVSPSGADAEDTVALAAMIKKRDIDGIAAWLTDEKSAKRLMAADALCRMDDHRGLPVVLREVQSKTVVDRRDAVRILGHFRVDAAVEPLIAAGLDDDATVRNYATSALQSTLQTLFPQRRFYGFHRGGYEDTEESRKERASVLRSWWTANRAASW